MAGCSNPQCFDRLPPACSWRSVSLLFWGPVLSTGWHNGSGEDGNVHDGQIQANHKMWPYSDENAKKADMEESRFNRLHGFMWGRIDDRSL
jgi:hypothetical protein